MVPLVIVEEHHEAFPVWERARAVGWLAPDRNSLWHVDEHSDLCPPAVRTNLRTLPADLASVRAFTYSELTVASFILASVYRGVFGEVVWTQHDKHDPAAATLHVTSAGRAGRVLSATRDIRAAGAFNPDRRHCTLRRTRPGTPFAPAGPLALDIDLDFFSCHDGPIPCRVEVTADEYARFRGDRYHPLRTLFGAQGTGEQVGGRFYLSADMSDPGGWGQGRVGADVIARRAADLARDVAACGATPAVVTVCRSRKSGYTANDQAELIEAAVLDALRGVLPFHTLGPDDLP